MDTPEKKTNPETPPQGNIWGWKFSIFGLILILAMIALLAFRAWQLGKPIWPY